MFGAIKRKAKAPLVAAQLTNIFLVAELMGEK